MSINREHATFRSLNNNRALVLDLLALASRHAYYPVEQTFELEEVAALRAAALRRISWTALFMKAYATVAAEVPQLRQAYCRWPWPRLCQCGENVAMVAINREYVGEERLCWGRFTSPEGHSLADLQDALDAYQREPVERIFRRQVRLSKCPTPLRRLALWLNLNFSRRRRAKRLGTFSMSTLAGQRTLNRFHPTLLTTSLSFGPLDDCGRALVTLVCDHRVLDGALAARALSSLQTVLGGTIADELRAMQAPRAAA
ncbi:MAG: hypothetical protein WD894_21415 [Pirellulales bacterium]